MENNQNTPREGGNNGERKPYHKHHRHRHQRKPGTQGERTVQNTENGGNIGVRPGRYDLPPSETHNEISSAPQKSEHKDARSSEFHGHSRRPHHKRSDRRPKNGPNHDSGRNDTQGETMAPETTDYSADNAASIQEETAYSEYITTAGSLDAEIIEELNSVSPADVEMLESSEEAKTEQETELAKYEIVGIRFKSGGKIYYFDPCGLKIPKGTPVIVETSRGAEFGVCDITNKVVSERELVLPLRPVTRIASKEDEARHEANVVKEKEAFAICSQKILDHKLGMKLIDVEYAFDGTKLLFYFTAEGRVDFRELVKDLASVFRTRIELRQIGIRDETKLLGGIGICGRPFCCKTFLSDFVQVSIKMAKEQNLSLNSAKISGACGRLMCCLRYEYDTYQEELKKTPKTDQIVSTPDGDGTVIEVQPLAGLVRVRFGSKADMIPPKVYHRDEVTVIGGKGVKPQEPAAE